MCESLYGHTTIRIKCSLYCIHLAHSPGLEPGYHELTARLTTIVIRMNIVLLGSEDWNRTNIAKLTALRPTVERPRNTYTM